MSVITTADECLSEAQQHVSAAIQSISKIVVDRCWGTEDFNDFYVAELRDALNKLLSVQDTLEE